MSEISSASPIIPTSSRYVAAGSVSDRARSAQVSDAAAIRGVGDRVRQISQLLIGPREYPERRAEEWGVLGNTQHHRVTSSCREPCRTSADVVFGPVRIISTRLGRYDRRHENSSHGSRVSFHLHASAGPRSDDTCPGALGPPSRSLLQLWTWRGHARLNQRLNAFGLNRE